MVRPLPLAEQEFAGWRYVSLKPTAADRSDAPPRNDVAEAQHVSRMQSEQGDIGRLRREEKEERQKAAKNVPMEHTFYERRALAMAALASSSSSSASTRYVAPPPPKAPFRSITLALDTTIALGKKAKKLQRTLTGARAVAAVAHARCPFVSSRLPLTLYVPPPVPAPPPFCPCALLFTYVRALPAAMDQKAEQMADQLDTIQWHRTPVVLPSDLRRAKNAAADLSDVTYEQALWRGARRAAVQPVFGMAPAPEEPKVEWRVPLTSLAKARARGEMPMWS